MFRKWASGGLRDSKKIARNDKENRGEMKTLFFSISFEKCKSIEYFWLVSIMVAFRPTREKWRGQCHPPSIPLVLKIPRHSSFPRLFSAGGGGRRCRARMKIQGAKKSNPVVCGHQRLKSKGFVRKNAQAKTEMKSIFAGRPFQTRGLFRKWADGGLRDSNKKI